MYPHQNPKVGTPAHLEFDLSLQNWPLPLHFNSWVRAHRKGAQKGPKMHFISFTPKAVIKAQNKSLFWGDVGVTKWSSFFALGHDVGPRSVLHRETFMIYAHSDANFVVQIRTHKPAIFSDWRSQNLPTFSSLQCMHISMGKVTHKRLEFWTS